ncbi:Hypothetical protein D9617_22g067490 [Elsinoe fawcettii]|nr:Hypothetical protein D9617_22g067490 [Elsinoe fawcettii]
MRFLPSLLALISAELALSHAATDTRVGENGATSYLPTCRSGSVNYITDRLPQQCIVSSRTAAASPSITDSLLTTSTPTATFVGAPEDKQTVDENGQGNSGPVAASIQPGPTSASSSSITESSQTSTSDTQTPSSPTSSANVDAEETPLDTANFLSFEEWKKKNLAKVGQSPEHVGLHRSLDDIPKRPRPGANALDVLGEDTEINLDFSGFGDATSPQQVPIGQNEDSQNGQQGKTSEKPTPEQSIRSKDAGRTCKERTNYASFDCAATIMKTNPECKSASSVLVENKDSYMLNICSVKNKFFIIELCDDILIDTVVLANYEFFSSIFRTFRLSVSDRYPAKPDKWRELGVYEARNTREVQPFLVEQSLIWARYLRIEILSHYGNEYYCPISLLRVHGTTMIEEFRHQDEIARGDYPEEVGEPESEAGTASPGLPQEPTESSIAADKSAAETPINQDSSTIASSEVPTSTVASPSAEAPPTTSDSTEQKDATSESVSGDPSNRTMSVTKEVGLQHYTNATAIVTSRPTGNQSSPTSNTSSQATNCSPAAASPTSQSSAVSSIPADTKPTIGETARSQSVDNKPSITTTSSPAESESSPTQSTSTTEQLPPTPTQSSTTINSAASPPPPSSQQSQPSNTISQPSTQSPSSSSIPSNPPKRSPTSPPPPTPSTQESFFKSLHKRLSALESNASLSLQYIEHQSLQLRDAFLSHSKSQSSRTSTFLFSLNDTVRAELADFRRQYDQLWESTVIELHGQRKAWESEMLELRKGVERLGEEGRGLRVLVGVQSTLLLLCLGLVIFGRGAGTMGGGTGWDARVLRMRMASPGSGSPGFVEGRGKERWWRRSRSPVSEGEDEGQEGQGKGVGWKVSPPSPDVSPSPPSSPAYPSPPGSPESGRDGESTEGEFEEADLRAEEEAVESVERDEQEIESKATKKVLETQSSPSTPTGSRDVNPVVQVMNDVMVNGIGHEEVA